MLAHILTLVASVVTGLGWLAALIIYLIYKDKSKFVAFHALQQLYFQIALFVATIIVVILIFLIVGFILLPFLILVALIVPILAGVNANKGDWYEIPVVGRLARQSVGV